MINIKDLEQGIEAFEQVIEMLEALVYIFEKTIMELKENE